MTGYTGEVLFRRLQVRTTAPRVLFTLNGPTGVRFPGNATETTVTTAPDGTATAPPLAAGTAPGTFLVKATLPRTAPL
ncbi:hypothetical protein SSPIM334S_07892 [Streptomyces spiroverticillatus]|uniref:hypothetical protein n=1 Tax=Streptomyces finlayi TaxID=67296 RepID=UPI00167B8129|nr:hypothetical protein [Streptomyces finlayi]